MSRPRVQSLIKLTYWTFSVGSLHKGFVSLSVFIGVFRGIKETIRNIWLFQKYFLPLCQRFIAL